MFLLRIPASLVLVLLMFAGPADWWVWWDEHVVQRLGA